MLAIFQQRGHGWKHIVYFDAGEQQEFTLATQPTPKWTV